MNLSRSNQAATLAAALTTILLWVLTAVAHVEVPAPVAVAFTTVLTFIVGGVVADVPDGPAGGE